MSICKFVMLFAVRVLDKEKSAYALVYFPIVNFWLFRYLYVWLNLFLFLMEDQLLDVYH